MALSVHTNYASIVSQNAMSSANQMMSNAMERLGTGYKINSAADDAAGLQIATRLQAQVNGLNVAQDNISDAKSFLQTAEGALETITDISYRMKDLATQANNGGTMSDDALANIQSEFDALAAEMSSIIDNTSYGSGTKLFDATDGELLAAVVFQVGATSSETLTVDVIAELGAMTTTMATLSALTMATAGEAATAMDSAGTLLNDIGKLRGALGANINRLDHSFNNLINMEEQSTQALGRIRDTDFAEETSKMTINQTLVQTGMSVLQRSNQMSGMVAQLLQ
jgi:flagellin